MKGRRPLSLLAATLLVASCTASPAPAETALPSNPSSQAKPSTDAPTLAPSPSQTATLENLMPELTVSGSFAVDDSGRSLAIACWGDGSPTIILEGGHPMSSLQYFAANARALVGKLAIRARTCAYDRAGYGASDPAPNEPRDLDDVTDDLRALLDAAEIEGPYILVGASFGGMIVTDDWFPCWVRTSDVYLADDMEGQCAPPLR